MSCKFGETVKFPKCNLQRDGYEFGKWRSTTKINGEYLEYDDKEEVKGGIPITATKHGKVIKFRPTWTWKLSIRNYSAVPCEVHDYTLDEGERFKLPSYNELFSEEFGYTFKCWYLHGNDGDKFYCKDKGTVKGPIDGYLYAEWGVIDYTVKINWTSKSSKSEKININSGEYTFPSTDKIVDGAAVTGYEIYDISKEEWVNIEKVGDPKGKRIAANKLIKNYADSKNVINLRPITEQFSIVGPWKIAYEVGDTIDLNEILNISTLNYSEITADNWKSANPDIVSNDDKSKPYIFKAKKNGETYIYLKLGGKKVKLDVHVGGIYHIF